MEGSLVKQSSAPSQPPFFLASQPLPFIWILIQNSVFPAPSTGCSCWICLDLQASGKMLLLPKVIQPSPWESSQATARNPSLVLVGALSAQRT